MESRGVNTDGIAVKSLEQGFSGVRNYGGVELLPPPTGSYFGRGLQQTPGDPYQELPRPEFYRPEKVQSVSHQVEWFTADLHFGHANIIKYCGRPFNDVDHMNEAMVYRWNDVVGDNDLVWILGDLALGNIGKSLSLVNRLKGNKILLCGNHDRPWAGHKMSNDKRRDWVNLYYDVGIINVVNFATGSHWWAVDKHDVVLSHFPYASTPFDERYAEARPVDQGEWLLHGHVHDAWKVNGRQINVGVDAWDFYPVHEATLLDIIEGGK